MAITFSRNIQMISMRSWPESGMPDHNSEILTNITTTISISICKTKIRRHLPFQSMLSGASLQWNIATQELQLKMLLSFEVCWYRITCPMPYLNMSKPLPLSIFMTRLEPGCVTAWRKHCWNINTVLAMFYINGKGRIMNSIFKFSGLHDIILIYSMLLFGCKSLTS